MIRNLLAALALCFTMTGALAADLPARSYPMAPVVYAGAAPVFSWTGFYVGADAGYAFTGSNDNAHLNVNNFGGPGGVYGRDLRGFTYGAHAGYNAQFGIFVVGAELGLNGGDVKGSDNYPQYFNDTNTKISYYTTAELKAGVAFDRVLVYVTGGIAGGDVKISQNYYPTRLIPTTFSSSKFQVGYTLGAGVEYALTDKWSVRGEYKFVDLGDGDHNGFDSRNVATNIRNASSFHVARIGVNYGF